MGFSNWLLFALAGLGLAITPGPNGLLALTHGAIYGTRKTISTILGAVIGFGVVIGISLFGIGALLQANDGLLVVLKWLGGGYLVFLGIQVWRSPAIGSAEAASTSLGGGAMFRAGFLAAVSNPKGILFFVAFLPQFVEPERPLIFQFLIMSLTYMVIEFLYEFFAAALSGKIQPLLKKSGKNFNRFFGLVFIAIGIFLPLRG